MMLYLRLLILCAAAALAASGQSLEVAGKVVDDDGNPIRGASLTLTAERDSSVKSRIRSSQDGRFVLPPVTAGAYVLVCEAAGFSPSSFPVKGADGGKLNIGSLILQAHGGANASQRIADARIGEDGKVQIEFADGKTVEVPPEEGQTGCTSISRMGGAVGWLVEYDIPGLSGVPLTLVAFRPEKPLRHFVPASTIYNWQFENGGRAVSITSGPLHGPGVDHPVHELWDVETGKMLKHWIDQ